MWNAKVSSFAPPFVGVMVIPTGVGASQGGFGGDATVWMNAVASVCDVLITHPNVANAAAFQSLPANTWYVEGYGLDEFFKGTWALEPVRQQRIGVILDAGLEAGMKTLQHNVVHAVQSTYGLAIVGIKESTQALRLSLDVMASGASGGTWENPQAVLSVAQALIHTHHATALALVARMEEPQDSVYADGVGVDPIGGLEAILSHTLVQALGIPVANAPCFDWEAAQPRRDALVHPFTASEYTTASFLPCVLQGLHRAPHFKSSHHPLSSHALELEQVNVLILPYDCLGGIPFLRALEKRIPVIVVRSNQSVLNLTAKALIGVARTQDLAREGLYYEVANYDEAVGLLQRLKLGLMLPQQTGVPLLN